MVNCKLSENDSSRNGHERYQQCCRSSFFTRSPLPPDIPLSIEHINLSQFDSELCHQAIADFGLEDVDFLILESPFQTPVVDPVTHTPFTRPRMCKLINHAHIFYQIPSDNPYNLHEIVLVELLHVRARLVTCATSRASCPERDIFVTWGIF